MAAIVANTGSNNWNTNGAWVGGVQPTAADDVTLPATAVVTIPTATTALARSVTVTASATLAFASTTAVLTIGDGTAGAGNVALSVSSTATITLTGIGVINFVSTAAASTQTLTTGGKTMPSFTINTGSTTTIQLADACTSSGTVTLTAGKFDTNTQTCQWATFTSNGAAVRTLTITGSAITLTATSTAFDIGPATNLTFNATGSTITMTGNSTTFRAGGVTVPTLTQSGALNCAISPQAALTITNYTRTGTASKTDVFTLSFGNVTFGTLTVTGNSLTNRMLMQTDTVGTTRTATVNTSFSFTNVDFQDITATGGAGTWTGTSMGDCQGNTGITFDTPVTQTWQGTTSGSWSNAAKWTSRVPLPQDNVVINAAFSASQTITIDMPRLGKNIDWTGTTGNPTWALNIASGTSLYGNLTLATGLISSAIAGTYQLVGRGAQTLTSSGAVLGFQSTISSFGGSYTLQDAYTSGNNFVVSLGTFTTNNFTVQTLSAQVGVATLNMGTSTWTLSGTAAVTIWNINAGATINASTSTIVVSNASANTRTFAGGGKTYGTLTYTVAGSTGALVITGANTFNTLNFSDASNARTLTLPASTITTVTTFNVIGTSTKLMTINSSTPGTAATVSKAGGGLVTNVDYLSIQDSTATPSSTWYAGAHSTLVSNDTGWNTNATVTNSEGFFHVL